ncbi:MAG: hypothetical protein IJT25_02825, partial [Clostridia bacterium]|nr:hypothetical protein [Clostridia bacterium]
NIFFVLLPIIDSATANVFSYSITDYPSTMRNSFLIARPDYLNKLVGLMFTLVALTLIQTLPGMIAQLVGAGDVYTDGDKVRKDAGSVLKDVGNVISGQAAINGIGKAKNALGQLSNFIPGSAFVKQAVNAFKNNDKKKDEKPAHDWGDNTNITPGENENEERRGRSGPREGGVGYSAPGSGENGNASEASHAFSSEMANSAGSLRENEERLVQEFNGENKEQGPLAEMDTETSENAMAQYAEAFSDAEEDGDKAKATDAARHLTEAYEENVKANLNNAMLSDGGEFTAREDMLENVKKGLRDGYTATAYNTGEKDATGQDIWAVAISKKTDRESNIENAIDLGKNSESKLTSDIKDFDKEIRNLDSQESALVAQRRMAETEATNIDNEMAKFLKSDTEVEEYKQIASGKAQQQQKLADARLELTDLQTKHQKALENSAKHEAEVNELQTRLNLARQDNDVESANKLEKQLKRAQQEKSGADKQISDYAESIRQKETTVKAHEDQIAKSDLRMHQLIHGQNNAEIEGLIKRKEENDKNIANINNTISDVVKQRGDAENRKAEAERSLESTRKGISRNSSLRDVEKGNIFAQRSEKASSEYNAAVKQQQDLSGLSKIINSKNSNITAENKSKAVDAYINRYYSGASDKQKADLKASLSTSSGVANHSKQVATTVSTKRAIANGARVKANSYLGQTEAPPIMAHTQMNSTNNGGESSSASSSRSTSTRTTSSSSGERTTRTTSSSSSASSGGYNRFTNDYASAGEGPSSSSSSREDRTISGVANRVRSGVVRKVTNIKNAVKNAPKKVVNGARRALERGASNLGVKPVTSGSLKPRVRTVVDARREQKMLPQSEVEKLEQQSRDPNLQGKTVKIVKKEIGDSLRAQTSTDKPSTNQSTTTHTANSRTTSGAGSSTTASSRTNQTHEVDARNKYLTVEEKARLTPSEATKLAEKRQEEHRKYSAERVLPDADVRSKYLTAEEEARMSREEGMRLAAKREAEHKKYSEQRLNSTNSSNTDGNSN